jgi:transposase
MAKYRVTLTEEERDDLLSYTNRGKGSARSIKRANILLGVDRGEFARQKMTDEQAAVAYNTSAKTVTAVKRAFVEEGLGNALGRKQREEPSHHKFDGEIEARIVALTCTDPPEGHARWTLRLLADTIVDLGIMDSISHVAVGSLLKKTNLSHGYTRNGASRDAHAST